MSKTLAVIVVTFVVAVGFLLIDWGPQTVTLLRMVGPGLLNQQMSDYQYYHQLGIPDGACFLMYQNAQGYTYGPYIWLVDSSKHYLTSLTQFGVPPNYVAKWDATGYWAGTIGSVNNTEYAQNLFVLVKIVQSP